MLKKISPDDVDLLCKMNNDIFINEIIYDRNFINRFCKLGQGFIYYYGDVPTGYILYGMVWRDNKREFTVVSIGVDIKHRGKGYGRLLLDRLVQSHPDREIHLNVRETNTVAQKLYSSIGFVKVEEVINYYHQFNENAYHMIKFPSK